MRVNPRQNNVNSVYKTHIDVIHFRKTDKKRLHERDTDRLVVISNINPQGAVEGFKGALSGCREGPSDRDRTK